MTEGPSPEALEALRADLRAYLGSQRQPPALMTAARRLQLRMGVLWSVLAPLLESGEVVVRSGGLVLGDRWSSPAAPAHRAGSYAAGYGSPLA